MVGAITIECRKPTIIRKTAKQQIIQLNLGFHRKICIKQPHNVIEKVITLWYNKNYCYWEV